MLFMSICTWKPENRDTIFSKFTGKGQFIPDGVKARGQWFDYGRNRMFGLFETDDIQDIALLALPWTDLMDIEFFPVMESKVVIETLSSK